MTFVRHHGDVHVIIDRDVNGRVTAVYLARGENGSGLIPESIDLSAEQAYAVADDIGVADPDTWAKRFPHQEEAELALRRVADYLKERAEANRQHQQNNDYFRTVAETFDLAVTAVLEEIENIYKEES